MSQVLHDGDLQRVGGGANFRPISQLTAAEAATIDVGIWKGSNFRGERIPSLVSVLAMFAGADVHLHVVRRSPLPPPRPF